MCIKFNFAQKLFALHTNIHQHTYISIHYLNRFVNLFNRFVTIQNRKIVLFRLLRIFSLSFGDVLGYSLLYPCEYHVARRLCLRFGSGGHVFQAVGQT